ncbi:MAG: peptide chain release factor N(5)-glutamine methyltransferase [Clostridiales bacterium]|nr:peptide chain release factor N(5)-glutamine methyltransferase [Clostridiales bacterium]
MSKNKDKNVKPVSIGGQAVLEGVMMRGKSSMATAVRDADGIIRIEKKRIKPQKERNLFFRLPLVRGVVSFISSLVGGSSVLMRSAEVYGEEEPSKAEKWLAEKLKINVMGVVTTLSLILGLALAVFLFMWLPQFIRVTIEGWCGEGFQFNLWAKNFIEGGLKLLIFLCYILLVSLMKDIRRTFMYHGAEHKTISCYEKGLELTVENARKCSRVHDRCGTTFMVFVMVISILTFALTESLIGTSIEKFYRVLLKLALLPIVAGLSYELLKLLAKTKSPLVYPLKVPGLLLQRITTREPDDDMLEVAITAFKAVMEMDEDPSIEEVEFVTAQKRSVLLEKVKQKLLDNGITEESESEWIVSLVIGCKRSELNCETLVTPKYVEEIDRITLERISGRPLWYCIGDTDFYGYKIKVDERVLIPRPETEILVSESKKVVKSDSKVLDLCTGSGAIAISVKKETSATVTASDISRDALSLAKENAKANGVDIEFVESDMFSALVGRKFDVIISNPPYIPSDDIQTLQKEVKDFEPTLALDGGKDGYVYYKIIADNARAYLNDNGVLLLECGIGQAEKVRSMLDGFTSVEIIKDYENIDRIVKAVL